MICPNCGLNFEQLASDACPRCGHVLAGTGTAESQTESHTRDDQNDEVSEFPTVKQATPASASLDAPAPASDAASSSTPAPSPSAHSSAPPAPPSPAPVPAPAWGTTSGGPSQSAGIAFTPTPPPAAAAGYGQLSPVPASGPLLPPSAQQQSATEMGPYGQSVSSPLAPYGQPAAVSSPLYGQPAASSGPLYGQGQPAAAASGPLFGQAMYTPQPGQDLALYGQSASAAEGTAMPWAFPEAHGARARIIARPRGRLILFAALAVVVVLALAGGGLVALSARGNGAVLFSDALTSDTGHWPTNSSCTFQPDGYHIVDGYICYEDAGTYGNVTINVQVRQVSGSGADAYSGIALRRVSAGNLYTFGISSTGQWMFVKTVGNAATAVAGPQASAAINRGLGSANTLQVQARGSHFDLFVNGTQVGSATDTTFSSGLCGLFVDQSIESAFTQFQVSR